MRSWDLGSARAEQCCNKPGLLKPCHRAAGARQSCLLAPRIVPERMAQRYHGCLPVQGLAEVPGQRSSRQPGSCLTALQAVKQGGDSCMPWDMSLMRLSAPKPCSGTPVAEEPPVCPGWPCSSSVGPSWERRVGSFVSSTRLSIRPRPLGPEKSGGEESHGSRRQMPAERKTRANVLWYGSRTGGSMALVTAIPLARGL